MASKLKRGLYALVGLVGVGFAVHYALFGSLPLGTPEVLNDDDADEVQWQEVDP